MSKRLPVFVPREAKREAALRGAVLAPFSRRAFALITDFLIAGLLFMAVTVGGGLLLVRLGLVDVDRDINFQLTFFENWYSVVWLVAYFAVSLWAGKGRTLGKKLFRIRVVSLEHERIGFWHAVERALGYGASALEAGMGFLQYFWSPNQRTAHDRLAGTIVVSDDGPSRSP
jgi:uncharacterized RDD family membrane protein YckC